MAFGALQVKACPHCVDEETESNKARVFRVTGGKRRKEHLFAAAFHRSGELNKEVKMPLTSEHKANLKGFVQPSLNLTLARGTSHLPPARN